MTGRNALKWATGLALALGVSLAASRTRAAWARGSSIEAALPEVSARMAAGEDAQLAEAASKGRTSTVEKLLGEGASPDARSAAGAPAITLAAKSGYADTVALLAGKGANVEAKDGSGSSALIVAANAGHARTVQVLVDARANVNAKRGDGQSALSLAQKHGFDEIVQILKGAGATG